MLSAGLALRTAVRSSCPSAVSNPACQAQPDTHAAAPMDNNRCGDTPARRTVAWARVPSMSCFTFSLLLLLLLWLMRGALRRLGFSVTQSRAGPGPADGSTGTPDSQAGLRTASASASTTGTTEPTRKAVGQRTEELTEEHVRTV